MKSRSGGSWGGLTIPASAGSSVQWTCRHGRDGSTTQRRRTRCLQVHWTELPALAGIVNPPQEPPLLLLIADREPVLDQDDAGADQHPLELRAGQHELI